MSTPEGKIKADVKKLLAKRKLYWHCPVMNGLGAPSLDFICCFKGHFFAIETKAGNKRPTPRQEITIAAMEAAGAKVFVINEVSGMSELESWLEGVENEKLGET